MSRPTGKCFRCVQLEYPVPKSSRASPTPSCRSWARISAAAARVLHGCGLGELELDQLGPYPTVVEHVGYQVQQSSAPEVVGREVDPDLNGRETGVVPTFALGGSLEEHPSVDGPYKAALLGQGDELTGKYQAPSRVTPANEGLDSHDLTGNRRHLGLVVDDELTFPHRFVEVGLELEQLSGLGVHGGDIALIVVAPRQLGPVHGGVGVLQQRLGVLPVVGIQRNADAGRKEQLLAVELERVAEDVKDALCYRSCVPRPGDEIRQQGELVASEPGEAVGVTDACLQPGGSQPEQLVSLGVAQAVVDVLEAVEVAEEQRQLAPVDLGLGQARLQRLGEVPSVGQLSKGVVVGEVLDALLIAPETAHRLALQFEQAHFLERQRGLVGHACHAGGPVLLVDHRGRGGAPHGGNGPQYLAAALDRHGEHFIGVDGLQLVSQVGVGSVAADVLGLPGGRGVAEKFGLINEVDIIMGTFSKSLAAQGGFIAADKNLIYGLRHSARSHIFSASLSPAIVGAVQAALNILIREPEQRQRLVNNAQYIAEGLISLGYHAAYHGSAIVPVFCGNELLSLALFHKLFEEGVFVNPVIHPAVPKNGELLRLSLMPDHTREQLDYVLEIFKQLRTEKFPASLSLSAAS